VEKLGIVRRLDATRIEYRANGVGYPDDPIRPARDAILLLLAITLQQRLEDGGPVRPIPGVVYRRLVTAPVYQPACDIVVHLMGCHRCTVPILMLIHAQPGHCLEDYARELRPIYIEHNLPTIISGPPIGEGDADDLPADVLPVWPERGELHRMEADTFGDLLETLSQVHCPGQRALTA
jgi:hypothetical protein